MRREIGHEQKLTRARTQLLLNQPFFGTLCLRLKLISGAVATMATDGRLIIYDSDFVESLKPAELEAVLAHEVLHCALGHHCRRGQRDPQLWNQAADLAINPILLGNGFTLPAGALVDPAFKNLSAEEIYARLGQSSGRDADSRFPRLPQASGVHGHENTQPQPQNAFSGSPDHPLPQRAGDAEHRNSEIPSEQPGGFGEVLDATDEQGNPVSQAENVRQQQEWNIAADQAIRSAKACGHEPAGLARPLKESRQSKPDWRTILRDSLRPGHRRITDGLHPTAATLAPVCTCLLSSGLD